MNGKGSKDRVKDKKSFDENYEKLYNDKCVSCDDITEYSKFDHVDFRIGYIEGAGQLCLECLDKIYVKKNKKLYKDNGDGTFTQYIVGQYAHDNRGE